MTVHVRSLLVLALVLFAAGAFVACGGSKDEPTSAATATAAVKTAPATTAAAVVTATPAVTATAASAGTPSTSAATPPIAATEPPRGTAAAVTLKEFTVAIDLASVPAGEVKFTVRNAGAIPHEMVLLKTDVNPRQLPLKEGVVDETRYKVVGAVREVGGGAVKTGTFGLDAAKYVLLCNIAGHPAAGMYTTLTVK